MTTKKFMNANDVCELLGVSRATAYRIIKRLNTELEGKGFMTLTGRVPLRYFNERFYAEREG